MKKRSQNTKTSMDQAGLMKYFKKFYPDAPEQAMAKLLADRHSFSFEKRDSNGDK